MLFPSEFIEISIEWGEFKIKNSFIIFEKLENKKKVAVPKYFIPISLG